MSFEIQAHRANDELTLRRHLRAGPCSVEIDVGVAAGEIVVAHDTDLADATGLQLERALAAAGGTTVVVEAKCFSSLTAPPREFVAALAPYLARTELCSFDPDVLVEARARHPALATTFLFRAPIRVTTATPTIGPRADLVTRGLLDAAHALGVRCVPWTVNDVREMVALVELGVDGLVTDEPALARVVVDSQRAVATAG